MSATTAGSDARHLDVEGGVRVPPADVGERLAERALEHDRLGRELDQAALDAGQHEQVVGDPAQPLGLVDDVRDELGDVLAVRVAGDDGRGAVDARDRRPELVGHDGEERLGRLAGVALALELRRLLALASPLRRDVAVGADEPDRPAGRVGQDPGPRQHVVDGAVREDDPVGEREHVAGGEPGGDVRLHVREVVRVDRASLRIATTSTSPAAGRRSPRRERPSPRRRSRGSTTRCRARRRRGRAPGAPPAPAARPRRHGGP